MDPAETAVNGIVEEIRGIINTCDSEEECKEALQQLMFTYTLSELEEMVRPARMGEISKLVRKVFIDFAAMRGWNIS